VHQIITFINYTILTSKSGYALFEVPYNKKDAERKLAQDELPALTKRSWRRPARFYFLTTPEEEQHKLMHKGNDKGSESPTSTNQLKASLTPPITRHRASVSHTRYQLHQLTHLRTSLIKRFAVHCQLHVLEAQ